MGILSPVASFAFTSLFLGSAMPAAERLPFMIAELAVFGLVSGLMSRKIASAPLMAFPAVICAQVAGRLVNFAATAIFGNGVAAAWNTIASGLPGLYLQAAVVPLIVIALWLCLKRGREDE